MIEKNRRNNPAPSINPALQAELTQIGGTVPPSGGHFAAQPVYRLAFGQQEQHFSRGRWRVRFPDDEIDELYVQERFYVTPELYSRIAVWMKERDADRQARFFNGDFGVLGEMEPISNYIRAHASTLEYHQLPSVTDTRDNLTMDVESIAATSVPPTWMYVADIADVIEIGKNCWFIMRWISSNAHGGRDMWERFRWTENAYIPELNCVVPIVDDLGAFSENGFWIPRIQIAEFFRDNNGACDPRNFRYLEPTRRNTVEPVIEELFEQAALTRQMRNKDFRAAQHNEELIEKRDRAEAVQRAKVFEILEVDQPQQNL